MDAMTPQCKIANDAEVPGIVLHIETVFANFAKIFYTQEFQKYKTIYDSTQFQNSSSIYFSSFSINRTKVKYLQFIGFLRIGEIQSPFQSPPKLFFYKTDFAFLFSHPSIVRFEFSPVECQKHLLNIVNKKFIKELDQFIDLFHKFIPKKDFVSPARYIAYIRWNILLRTIEPDICCNFLEELINFCKQNQESEKLSHFGKALENIIGPIHINTEEEIAEFYFALCCLIIEEGISNRKLVFNCLNSLQGLIEKSLLQRLLALFSSFVSEKEDSRGTAIVEIIEFLVPNHLDIANLLYRKAKLEIHFPILNQAEIEDKLLNRPIHQRLIALICPKKEETTISESINKSNNLNILLFYEKKFLEIYSKFTTKSPIDNPFNKHTFAYAKTLETVLQKCEDTKNISSFKSYLFVAWSAHKVFQQEKTTKIFSLKSYPRILNWLKENTSNLEELVQKYPFDYVDEVFQELKGEKVLLDYYELKIGQGIQQIKTKINNKEWETIEFITLRSLFEWGKRFSIPIPVNYDTKFPQEIEDLINVFGKNLSNNEKLIITLCQIYNNYIPFLFSSRHVSKKIELAKNLFYIKNVTAAIVDLGITILQESLQLPKDRYEESKETLLKNLIEHLTKGPFPIAWKVLTDNIISCHLNFQGEKLRVDIIQKFVEVGLTKSENQSKKIISNYFMHTRDVSALKILKYLLERHSGKDFYSSFFFYFEKNGIEKKEDLLFLFKKMTEENEPLYLIDLFYKNEAIVNLINIKNGEDQKNLSFFCEILGNHLYNSEIIYKVNYFFSILNKSFSFTFIQERKIKEFFNLLFEKSIYFNQFEIASHYIDKVSGDVFLKLCQTDQFDNFIKELKRTDAYIAIFHSLSNSKQNIADPLSKLIIPYIRVFITEDCLNVSGWSLFASLLKKYKVECILQADKITSLLLENLTEKPSVLKFYGELSEKFSLTNVVLISNILKNIDKIQESKNKFLTYVYYNDELMNNTQIAELLISRLIVESPLEPTKNIEVPIDFSKYMKDKQRIIPILKNLDQRISKRFIESLFAIIKNKNSENILLWGKFSDDLGIYNHHYNWLLLVLLELEQHRKKKLCEIKLAFIPFEYFFSRDKVFKGCCKKIMHILNTKENHKEEVESIDLLYNNTIALFFLLHNEDEQRLEMIKEIFYQLSSESYIFNELTSRIKNFISLESNKSKHEKLLEIINDICNPNQAMQKQILQELKEFKDFLAENIISFNINQLNFTNCFFLNIFYEFIFEIRSTPREAVKKYQEMFFSVISIFHKCRDSQRIIEFTSFVLYFLHQFIYFLQEPLHEKKYLETLNLIKNNIVIDHYFSMLICISPREFCLTNEISIQRKFGLARNFLKTVFSKFSVFNEQTAMTFFSYATSFLTKSIDLFSQFEEDRQKIFIESIYEYEGKLESLLSIKLLEQRDIRNQNVSKNDEYERYIITIMLGVDLYILNLVSAMNKNKKKFNYSILTQFFHLHWYFINQSSLFLKDTKNLDESLLNKKITLIKYQFEIFLQCYPHLKESEQTNLIQCFSSFMHDEKKGMNSWENQIKDETKKFLLEMMTKYKFSIDFLEKLVEN